MARKRLQMRKLREILRLKYEVGLSHRAVSKACSIGLGTVSLYLKRAADAGLTWPLPTDADDAALESMVFRRPVSHAGPRPRPDMASIHQELKRPGVTLYLLWMEYLENYPDGYRYSQYCDLYRRWRKKLNPSMRQPHKAGEKSFIDYSGKKPHYIDQETGEEIQVELFVAALGASNYTFAEATMRQDLPCWVESHNRMSEYFGGTSEIWVPDNLKSGVTKPCRYEPEINRTYQELADHYGAVVIPARVRRPKDKAKVEGAVLIAQRWILAVLRDRTFFSLSELNAGIREALDKLNHRPMKKLGVSRRELFEKLDQPALNPLPGKRYEMAEWKRCRVNIDYHVEVDRNYYSVPYQLLHERVEARTTVAMVEIFHKDKRVASHRRLPGRGKSSTRTEHMPRSHRAHTEWSPSRLIHWAEKAGPATGRLVAEILRNQRHPENGYRSCLGVMRLGKRHGEERLEAACARAETLRSYSYRTVKNILSSGMDRVPLEKEATLGTSPDHENIRGADYYQKKEEKC